MSNLHELFPKNEIKPYLEVHDVGRPDLVAIDAVVPASAADRLLRAMAEEKRGVLARVMRSRGTLIAVFAIMLLFDDYAGSFLTFAHTKLPPSSNTLWSQRVEPLWVTLTPEFWVSSPDEITASQKPVVASSDPVPPANKVRQVAASVPPTRLDSPDHPVNDASAHWRLPSAPATDRGPADLRRITGVSRNLALPDLSTLARRLQEVFVRNGRRSRQGRQAVN